MIDTNSSFYIQNVEKVRKTLRRKRIQEQRSDHLHDILEGFEQTIIAPLFVRAQKEGKDPIETIHVFFAAIRHLLKDSVSIEDWDQITLVKFVKANYRQIAILLKENSMAKNMGQRTLPILAMLAKAGLTGPFNSMELGASCGFIGRALMNPQLFLDHLDNYCRFSSPSFRGQLGSLFRDSELPKFESYVGVDKTILNLKWNFACIEEDDKRQLLQNFLNIFPDRGLNETLVCGDAVEFMVTDQVQNTENPLLITSMMLYQLPQECRKLLETRIKVFLQKKAGYWTQLTYDQTNNRFLARLLGFNSGEKVIIDELLLKDGDAMEWKI